MPAARKKQEEQVPDGNGLSRSASLVFGAAIVLLGGLVLASHYVPDLSLRTLWPLFLLVPISVLTMTFLRFRAKAVGTLVPLVILTGLMIYFQDELSLRLLWLQDQPGLGVGHADVARGVSVRRVCCNAPYVV